MSVVHRRCGVSATHDNGAPFQRELLPVGQRQSWDVPMQWGNVREYTFQSLSEVDELVFIFCMPPCRELGKIF